MKKLGIRGTATAELAFHDMHVPKKNVLGPLGKGLKVALTVLDFGRTTFGACCTGAAKTCLQMAVRQANSRRQFDRHLGEFELVRKKIAQMAAWVYAMESMTYVTAGLIDRGLEDYMLETAMLKVSTTEALWRIVNDTFQIHGGAAYFTDLPLERMLRDARINQIGEGANDVLRSFIALVGMRGPGTQLRELWDALQHPVDELRKIWRYGLERADAAIRTPDIPVQSTELRSHAQELGRLIKQFEQAVRRCMIRHGEAILDRQFLQERITEAAMGLFACSCVISRWDSELTRPDHGEPDGHAEHAAAELFLKMSVRRIRQHLAELRDNDDQAVTNTAVAALEGDPSHNAAS